MASLIYGVHKDGRFYWPAVIKGWPDAIVTIERVMFYGERYYYVSYSEGRVGTFPGTDSDEWIEVVW